ncbi:hypothetical protein DD509_06855 [Dehalogenimonas alkenigignens]|nr:hypothetical protein DD509_06855 [Dehalogenimonas alkenigignens]
MNKPPTFANHTASLLAVFSIFTTSKADNWPIHSSIYLSYLFKLFNFIYEHIADDGKSRTPCSVGLKDDMKLG